MQDTFNVDLNNWEFKYRATITCMGCKPSKPEPRISRMASSCREISMMAEDMLAREIHREQARAKFRRATSKIKMIHHITS